MDTETFKALQQVISFARRASTPTEHADVYYQEIKKVVEWMLEFEKQKFGFEKWFEEQTAN